MADQNEANENDAAQDQETDLKNKISSYEKLIEKLKKERLILEKQIDNDYRNARRYVRSHPEEGVVYSFLGGIALGIIIGKLTK